LVNLHCNTIIFLIDYFVTGGSSLNEPGQLRSSDIDNMLNKGKLKCYYFNNKDAEIYLQMQL
jgi:cell division protease FtsH